MRLVPFGLLVLVSAVAYSRPVLTGKLVAWTLVGVVLAMIATMIGSVRKGGK